MYCTTEIVLGKYRIFSQVQQKIPFIVGKWFERWPGEVMVYDEHSSFGAV